MVTAYCVKCKVKGRAMKDAAISQTVKGGYMAKGKCTTCGTVMCAMMSKDKAEVALKAGEAKKNF